MYVRPKKTEYCVWTVCIEARAFSNKLIADSYRSAKRDGEEIHRMQWPAHYAPQCQCLPIGIRTEDVSDEKM